MNKINLYLYQDLSEKKFIEITINDDITIKDYFSNCSYIPKYDDYYFLNNFKTLSHNDNLSSYKDIIIIKKTINTYIPNISQNIEHQENQEDQENQENQENQEDQEDQEDQENQENQEKINKYIKLLNKHPELISFIYLLSGKTEITDTIILYLEKFSKKNIYNIIKNNQQDIIDMVQHKPNIIEIYFKNITKTLTNNSNFDTSNFNVSNILTNLVNQNLTSLVIADIENIFPDVPQENIQELINVFHNQPLII